MLKKKLTGVMLIKENGFDVLTFTYNEMDMNTRQVVAMNKQSNVIIDQEEVSEIRSHLDAVENFVKLEMEKL
ncbi:hypothetical protein [Clostridium chrysemydis]|uniref:hypothetical protein n=1 Tax=Clostridium chrysemydis TaxID=2665504 RepID=UPI0018833C86|nr:hypothetical protein [Clostridium chrysemydis]